MDEASIDELAAAYVAEYVEGGDARAGAWDAVEALVVENPEAAWAVIERAIAMPVASFDLGRIGAGPLEELLRDYPMMFVERAIARARIDPRFREAMQFVRLDDDIAGVIEHELRLKES